MSTPTAPSSWAPPGATGALVGRRVEMARLQEGLSRAKGGRGFASLVLGQGGMGKTRMLRWLEREAQVQGFQVRWGNGLKEAISPFFVFEQIFRTREGEVSPGGSSVPGLERAGTSQLPPSLLYEEDRPRRMRLRLSSLDPGSPLLFFSRDSPASLRDRGGPLPSGFESVWITRMEGEGRIPPGNIDGIGERASQYFRHHPGAVIALDGVEYLCSQSGFRPVLRLLQFLRDVAQETDGHLIVSVNPAAFDAQQLSLLESDAEVERVAAETDPRARGPETGETPANALLRYLRVLEESARQAPQLIVVDDLHWADAQSGVAFQFLAHNTRDLPVFLVGGAREDEISSQADEQGASMESRLRGLEQEGRLERVPLAPFGLEETRLLAWEVLGAPLAAHDQDDPLEELLHRTGGNPYFLRETVLQLKEDGLVRLSGAAYRFHLSQGTSELRASVPTSLRRLVIRRLSSLTTEERELLDLAAVAGSEFPLQPLASVRGWTLEKTRSLIQGLERDRRLVEMNGDEPGNWLFSHPLVWEVTMGEMSAALRRREARALLDWWEEHRPQDIPTLARLAHDTADPNLGLPWVRAALATSLRGLAPEAAASYLQWMHDLHRVQGSPGREEGALEAELDGARRLARCGGHRRAVAFIESLLNEGVPKRLEWQARFSLLRALEHYDSERASRLLEDLWREVVEHEKEVPPKVRNSVADLRGYYLQQKGRNQEALDMYRLVVTAPVENEELETRTHSLLASAYCEAALGHREASDRLLEEARKFSEDAPSELAQVRHVESLIFTMRFEYEKGVAASREAAAAYREAGSLIQAGINEYNAGETLVQLGREAEAEPIARQLLETGRKFEIPRLSSSGNFLMARIETNRKHWKEALPWAEASLKAVEGLRRPDDIRDCRVLIANIRGEMGDTAWAVGELEALEREGHLGSLPVAYDIYPLLGRFREAKGDRSGAREAFLRAAEAAKKLGSTKDETHWLADAERLRAASPGGATQTSHQP